MSDHPDYLVWGTTSVGGFASVTDIEGVARPYELAVGIPRADRFSPEAAYRMDPRHPRDVRLPDAIRSTDGAAVPIVSPALRAEVKRAEPAGVEFLPVTIYDHKGRVATDAYTVMNPTLILGALDLDAMDVEWSPLAADTIDSCEGIVLDPTAVADAPALFRIQRMENTVVIRRDLAEALKEEGLTGLYFTELADVSD